MSTGTTTVYIGTYTPEFHGRGLGIHPYQRDPASGALSPSGEPLRTPSPSYVTANADGSVLYAVNELDDGTVSAYARESSGALRRLGGSPSTGGASPCHVRVLPNGGYLLATNYTSGSVSVHPIDDDGSVGELTDLFTGTPGEAGRDPHTHQSWVHPDDGTVVVTDLGADVLRRFELDEATGRLTALEVVTLPAGAGPRHVVHHPDGKLYVACELDSTIAVVDTKDGALKLVESGIVTTAHTGSPNYPSEIALSGDDRFLYLANRGANTVATFAVGDKLERITETPCGGDWPRHMAVAGGHLYVANQNSDGVAVFDVTAGVPVATGTVVDVPTPTCVLPAP